MKPTEQAKVTLRLTKPISLELMKKYACSKPLRRPAPGPSRDAKPNVYEQ